MGTGVTCPTYRVHPAQVAHAFATLGLLYPGRVFLGVGTGEAVNEAPTAGWGPYRERAGRLVEAIDVIRALWTGNRLDQAGDHEGRYYNVHGAKLYDIPPTPVPVYVAASGVRSCAIAGAHGDGWITDGHTLQHGAAQRDAFESAARGAGRDPAAMPKLVELWAVVGDRNDALDAARRWLFLRAFEHVVDIADPREVQRVAEARVTPEEVVSGWVVSRDPDEHIAAVRALAAAGATHIFLHSPQPDQRAAIEFYGTSVLPAL
jgi:G6PDH family F420-dependent oxidoreductase